MKKDGTRMALSDVGTVKKPEPDQHGQNGEPPAITPAELRRTVIGTAIGSSLEYFDFTLYVLASSLIFAQLFFSNVPTDVGRILSFLTLFAGFAIRPIGGLVLARVGDRIGRKTVLLVTIVMMGASSLAIGLLPTFATIGVWAPIILTLLRIIQGFGAGAEAAGASTLMTEVAPKGKRGFYSALQYSGLVAGTALASVAFILISSAGNQALLDGLWRVPFILSAVLVVIAYWLRRRVRDSPTFTKIKEHGELEKSPVASVFKSSKKALFVGMGLRMAEGSGTSIYKSLAATFLASVVFAGRDGSTSLVAIALLVASGVGIFTVPLVGALSDRFGRRPMFIICSGLQIATAFPIWWTFAHGNSVAIVIAMTVGLAFGAWACLSLQGATIPELFAIQHRYTGVVLSRELPSIWAGGLVPTLGALLLAFFSNSWIPLAALTVFYAAFTFIAALVMNETRDRDLGSRENSI
jgi:MHS family metabolite:H+ symporter-like MFS transporter